MHKSAAGESAKIPNAPLFREAVDKALSARNIRMSSPGKSTSPEMLKLLSEASRRFQAEGHGEAFIPTTPRKILQTVPNSPDTSVISERSKSSSVTAVSARGSTFPFSTSPLFDAGLEATDFPFETTPVTPVPPPVITVDRNRSHIVDVNDEFLPQNAVNESTYSISASVLPVDKVRPTLVGSLVALIGSSH